jgi:hypothetical protein
MIDSSPGNGLPRSFPSSALREPLDRAVYRRISVTLTKLKYPSRNCLQIGPARTRCGHRGGGECGPNRDSDRTIICPRDHAGTTKTVYPEFPGNSILPAKFPAGLAIPYRLWCGLPGVNRELPSRRRQFPEGMLGALFWDGFPGARKVACNGGAEEFRKQPRRAAGCL